MRTSPPPKLLVRAFKLSSDGPFPSQKSIDSAGWRFVGTEGHRSEETLMQASRQPRSQSTGHVRYSTSTAKH
ncbi:hypothetical protein MRB53_040719 [Persea americana]|nr:hypothetical protein MRB53_040719 [Persea americana]